MWSKHNHKNKQETKDSRMTVIVAVIFLFAVAIILRLFNIQILDHELYAAKALRQHGVEKEIIPKRGRVFVRTREEKTGLYPLATNKEFALVYVVPKDVVDPEKASEQLAEVFYELVFEEPDRELLIGKIEQNLRETMANVVRQNNPPALGEEIIIDEAQLEISLAKERLALEDQLNKEKEENLKNYQAELLAKLSKQNDPYEPLIKKVDENKLQEIIDLKIAGINYSKSFYRYYPEDSISSHVLGFVVYNHDNAITQGSYGIEGYFNQELRGTMGSLTAERDASGRTIIVADRQVEPAKNGDDIVLTINKTIQDVACRKLNASALRHGADLGSVIIMDPKTGAIIAMCSYPDFNPNKYGDVKDLDNFNNIGIFNAYEPGSVFKPVTMAMGLDLGLVNSETIFNDTGSYVVATETMKNSDDNVYGEVTMSEVLEYSINTGVMYVARQVGINNFRKYTQDFGFGNKTGIRLKTEVEGNISSLWDKMHGDNLNMMVSSFGQSITSTPLQLGVAFSAIANQGILVKPYIIDEIIKPDGEHIKTQVNEIKRVISPRTAMMLSGMLVNVVDGGHAKLAGVDGYYVAGKTGTAQIASENSRGYSNKTNHTFVGFAPADNPEFVMVVYLKNPKDVLYSASSAAPLFGEIAEFVLNYCQVEKER